MSQTAVKPLADDYVPEDVFSRYREARDEAQHIVMLDTRIQEAKDKLKEEFLAEAY